MNASTRQRRPAARRTAPEHRSRRPRPVVRVKTDPRFSRRRRAVAREHRRRLILRLSAVGIVVLGVWGAFFSPLLRVGEVKVTGARRTATEDILAAADLGSNDNLLLLSTSEVADRLLELPWVRSVDVDRMLPGTVRIKVAERRPAMVLSLGAAKWTIDATGRVLGSGVVGRDLPVLAGVQVVTVEPGVRLRTTEAQAALAVWRRLPKSVRREVVGIVAPTLERVTLSLADDTLVRYGAPEDAAAKNEILTVLLRRLRADGTQPAYIDVRVPTHPAIGPRSAGVERVTDPDADAGADPAAEESSEDARQ